MPEIRVEISDVVCLVVDRADRDPSAFRKWAASFGRIYARVWHCRDLNRVGAESAIGQRSTAAVTCDIAVITAPSQALNKNPPAEANPDKRRRVGIRRKIGNPTVSVSVKSIVHVVDEVDAKIQLAAAECSRTTRDRSIINRRRGRTCGRAVDSFIAVPGDRE